MGIEFIIYGIILLLAIRFARKQAGKALPNLKLPNLGISSGLKSGLKKTFSSVKTVISKTVGKPGKKTKRWIAGIIIAGIAVWFLWPKIQSFRFGSKVAFSGETYDTTLVMAPHMKLIRTVPSKYGLNVQSEDHVVTTNNKGESYTSGHNHSGSIVTIENKNSFPVSVRLLYQPTVIIF